MTRERRIRIIYANAGGGHRAAAAALTEVFQRQARPWRVTLCDFQDVINPFDPILKITGVGSQEMYNQALRHGWTLATAELLPVLRWLVRVYHDRVAARYRELWAAETPDMVISVLPLYNAPLNTSLREAAPNTPFVTILTDFADLPPNFWIERNAGYVVCGTSRAAAQAEQLGYPPERICHASGMIMHPRFYDDRSFDATAERERAGLDPATPTGIVMFGGQGSTAILDIVRRLDRSDTKLQLIAMCGHNARLATRLRALRTRKALHVADFTTEIPRYLSMADFFIGKPGPGSVSEALHFGLPVIVERNMWTLPQERYNTDWIVEKGVGIVLRSFSSIDSAVSRLLSPAEFPGFRARASAVRNGAVFEIPEFLERIFEKGSGGAVHAANRNE